MGLEHIIISERNTAVSNQECVGNTVGTELNKSLPTEIIKSDNIATEEHEVGKVKIGKNDANVNTSIHRKQTYAQIMVGGKMRSDELNSPNITSGEK